MGSLGTPFKPKSFAILGTSNDDRKTLADVLIRIGRLVSQHPEIKELDLKLVRVYEKGVMVLDALMVVD